MLVCLARGVFGWDRVYFPLGLEIVLNSLIFLIKVCKSISESSLDSEVMSA